MRANLIVKKFEPLRAVLSPAKFFYDLEVIQNRIDFGTFRGFLIEISLEQFMRFRETPGPEITKLLKS